MGGRRPKTATAEDRLRAETALRAEADALLAGGLRETLASYGDVHIVGSHRMRLMAWRDLDIHLVPDILDRSLFFELGRHIAALLGPRRMHYRDETGADGVALPRGLYWGVHVGDAEAEGWKLDIWATDPPGLQRVESYCAGIERRLTPRTRNVILMLKSACWRLPGYRRGFGSSDIYTAVLDHGVGSLDAFMRFLEARASRGPGGFGTLSNPGAPSFPGGHP